MRGFHTADGSSMGQPLLLTGQRLTCGVTEPDCCLASSEA
jgi:hypothetical protein